MPVVPACVQSKSDIIPEIGRVVGIGIRFFHEMGWELGVLSETQQNANSRCPKNNEDSSHWYTLYPQFKYAEKMAGTSGKGDSTPLLFIAATTKKDPNRTNKEAIARFHYGMDGEQLKNIKWVYNWDQFYDVLGQYSSITKLVIHSHGIPAGIGIGDEYRFLSTVAKGFDGRKVPVVNEISFEGCNVGVNPAGLLSIGKRLGTQKISAYTFFMYEKRISVSVPSKVSREDFDEAKATLMKKLAPFKRYLMPEQSTPSDLLSSPGQKQLFLEWFRPEKIEEYPELDVFGSAPKNVVTRDSAKETIYRTSQGVPERPGDEMVPEFEHVTILLDKKADDKPVKLEGAESPP